MAYKTILVHCDASPKVGARLAVAVDLAQRSDARLVGVHVRAPFEAPAFFDGTMPMDSLFQSYESASTVEEKAARAAFDKALKGTQVANEWRVADGYGDDHEWTATTEADAPANFARWLIRPGRAAQLQLDVYVSGGTATSAVYEIVHAGTTDHVMIDQTMVGGFVSLGDFAFTEIVPPTESGNTPCGTPSASGGSGAHAHSFVFPPFPK